MEKDLMLLAYNLFCSPPACCGLQQCSESAYNVATGYGLLSQQVAQTRNELDRLRMEHAFYDMNTNVVNTFCNTRPVRTIYDLDRALFPNDPIRAWAEAEAARIDAKYAWAER